MSKVLVTEAYLGDIADAIREKNGGTDTYTPGQMAAAIASIPQGSEPVLQSKTVTENGTVTPDEGYDGLSSVTVNVEGGGNVYSHSVHINAGGKNFRTLIISTSDTPFTMQSLIEWLYNKGFTGSQSKLRYFAVGEASEYTDFVNAIASSGSNLKIYFGNSESSSSTGTLTDTVIQA